jgi:type I restriction enzyme R subunit
LETFYEIISPDKFLRDYLDNYAKLSYLYEVVQNAYSDHVLADKELMSKTSVLVRKAVELQGLKKTLPVIEINDKTLEAWKKGDRSDNNKVINLAKSLRVDIESRMDSEPYLILIGERVQAVMELYDSRQIETKKALTELEEIMKEVIQARKEMVEKGMDINQFTIYWTLKRAGVDVKKAEKLTPEVNEIVVRHCDWEYDGEDLRKAKIELYKILRPVAEGNTLVKLVDQILRLERKDDGKAVEKR